ncbi:hypothetical protein L227DRAFT_581632, partial [Lentinus tigrinus ALCF2SS1-6]
MRARRMRFTGVAFARLMSYPGSEQTALVLSEEDPADNPEAPVCWNLLFAYLLLFLVTVVFVCLIVLFSAV